MCDYTVLPYTLFNICRYLAELSDKTILASGNFNDISGSFQFHRHHGICRDEVAEDSCIVAGAEGAANKPSSVLQGVSNAVQIQRLSPGASGALESIFVADIVAVVGKGGLGLLL